jgi:hypothetical protein
VFEVSRSGVPMRMFPCFVMCTQIAAIRCEVVERNRRDIKLVDIAGVGFSRF